MGSYWKSMAAEVLPSWLKNLRAGRRAGHMTKPALPQKPAADADRDAGEGDGSNGGETRLEPPVRPGTTEPKER
ncbi:hypothetical protein [Aquibium sp. ELW1220]|uniref:hypothetical protein n=1 Tax=Aquibium sp. ELW1220 TaxID=2976766 RepID=UPI0025B0579A|nr:hypothetical protein [Aquibium sp. ELW1220]MDN2578481.1 hypothetical protein [Aquibium sp. ELW1220]